MSSFFEAFWKDSLWLPPNTTWSDLDKGFRSSGWYASHLESPASLPFVAAVVICSLRYSLTQLVFKPWLRRRIRKPFPHISQQIINAPLLNGNTKTNGTAVIVSESLRIAPKIKMSPSKIQRACDSAWYFSYFSIAFSYGVWALWDKPYLTDQLELWRGYPNHPVPREIHYYYVIAIGYCWSCFAFQFFDSRKKDFWQTAIHHLTTLLLLYFSWMLNWMRVGAVILLLHDISDIFLQASNESRSPSAAANRAAECGDEYFAPRQKHGKLGLLRFRVIRLTFSRMMSKRAKTPEPQPGCSFWKQEKEKDQEEHREDELLPACAIPTPRRWRCVSVSLSVSSSSSKALPPILTGKFFKVSVDSNHSAAKFFNYIGRQLAAEVTFGVFFIVWMTTRVYIYPKYILYSVFVDCPRVLNGDFFVGYILLALLYILFTLHLIWTAMILRILKLVVWDRDVRDTRSPDSSDAED
ncbi:unnamed protein product [Cyprideis torosa]|uniref:Uncharacterized protein n=1 Tax=Cyprideis torosa TaxID=163714 RepID=A0A7R8ZK77_9CRUS|nr:unnamed protein product [Cyprideis torosa]CAG0883908.1 unnamed protein product [Cyprideis torosa]